jgi:hypothetical protein
VLFWLVGEFHFLILILVLILVARSWRLGVRPETLPLASTTSTGAGISADRPGSPSIARLDRKGSPAGRHASSLRYDRRPLRRFLVLALPALVLTMALFRSAVEALGRAPELLGAAPELRQHAVMVILTWLLEAVALAALYLLVQGSGGSRLLNGVLTGWIAWVFRGPLLVIAVVTLAGQPAGPWWSLTFSWWVLYTICGLLLGIVAAASGLKPGPVADTHQA